MAAKFPGVGKFPLPKGSGNMPSGAAKGGGVKAASPDDIFRTLAKLRLLQKYGRSSGFEQLLGDSG